MYDYVLFDLDGTLTDPYIGITNSIIYSLQQMNIEAPDNSALIPFIGPPLHESYRTVYNLQDEDNATAIKHYRTYFSDKGMYENEVYAGIEIVLQALKAQGSNSSSRQVNRLISQFRYYSTSNLMVTLMKLSAAIWMAHARIKQK